MNAIGGARGAMRNDFSNSYRNYLCFSDNLNNVPSSKTVTYEGIFNEAFFKVNSKEEKKTINMEISFASLKNPISNENEVWLGTLLKSKYDGQKIDKLIDLLL